MRLSSGSWVFTDTFQIAQEVRVPHVQLTRQAELFVIMPATANIIGKLASGICDDLVSAAAVACTCPLILVPTMNASMWENPIVQRNVRILRTAGRAIVEPARGYEVADWQLSAVTIPPFDALVRQLRAAMQSPQRESWPSGNGG
jgi:phosphopantothenoylcysteine decarboxylase/phosphopantothenate--cysteine ligase